MIPEILLLVEERFYYLQFSPRLTMKQMKQKEEPESCIIPGKHKDLGGGTFDLASKQSSNNHLGQPSNNTLVTT